MSLKTDCNKVGLSVSDFSELVNVPYQTLIDWHKTRPQLMNVLFNGIACNNILDRVEELREQSNEDLKPRRESEA